MPHLRRVSGTDKSTNKLTGVTTVANGANLLPAFKQFSFSWLRTVKTIEMLFVIFNWRKNAQVCVLLVWLRACVCSCVLCLNLWLNLSFCLRLSGSGWLLINKRTAGSKGGRKSVNDDYENCIDNSNYNNCDCNWGRGRGRPTPSQMPLGINAHF